jgi:hypothetical protein
MGTGGKPVYLFPISAPGFEAPFRSRLARCWLAARAEVAAPPRHDHTSNFFFAANAGFSFALVDAMADLKSSAVAVGIHVVRNRRAFQPDRSRQDFTNRAMERGKLRLCESCGDARRMNPRAEQAFIRIYIAHSAQDALIEQKGFDARAARAESRAKFFQCNFQRLRSEPPLKSGHE